MSEELEFWQAAVLIALLWVGLCVFLLRASRRKSHRRDGTGL
jgi:hypothetical protein